MVFLDVVMVSAANLLRSESLVWFCASIATGIGVMEISTVVQQYLFISPSLFHFAGILPEKNDSEFTPQHNLEKRMSCWPLAGELPPPCFLNVAADHSSRVGYLSIVSVVLVFLIYL
ncbi:hypothetical protein SLEP1_g21334 [Rubroshorea leprosula]|uniref:Uncharacterized protein n=1 Tax=Rubroshorea leprosula TaxID=152421 RepID=A0AAV5JG86_9ROSI|nr:hypothetical protein SLEP1_g21334 [Rubroshorea leprosula]